MSAVGFNDALDAVARRYERVQVAGDVLDREQAQMLFTGMDLDAAALYETCLQLAGVTAVASRNVDGVTVLTGAFVGGVLLGYEIARLQLGGDEE